MNQTVGVSAHILVADDDPGVRYVLKWALESVGHQVRTVATGGEALNAIQEDAPALLVLDLTMPLTDGSQVASELRSRGKSVPILLITGDGRASEKAFAVGAYGYLQKPFDVNELVSAVRRGLAA